MSDYIKENEEEKKIEYDLEDDYRETSLLDDEAYYINSSLSKYYKAGEILKKNKFLKEKEEYFADYDKKPHVKIAPKIEGEEGRFIGFDGKRKKFLDLSKEEKQDWEKQNMFKSLEYYSDEEDEKKSQEEPQNGGDER